MFGRQSTQMQVVPVDGLAEIIKGVATIRQPAAQPPYTPPQPQPSSTMITIYIHELHVHPQGSWQDGGARQLGQPLTGLPEPQSTNILPIRSIDPNAAAVPPALRCAVCGHGIPNGHEVRYRERYYHPRCWQVADEVSLANDQGRRSCFSA